MSRQTSNATTDPDVRYGIYNTAKGSFQFHICEDTPEKAMQALLAHIGPNARKRKFQPRPIPGYRTYPRVSVTVRTGRDIVDWLSSTVEPACKGRPDNDACVGKDICPYADQAGMSVRFAVTDGLLVEVAQAKGCPPDLTASVIDAKTGKRLRDTTWRRTSPDEDHYTLIHDHVVYDVFFETVPEPTHA